MGKYSVEVDNIAKKELAAHYKSGDKKAIKRIERIFQELSETQLQRFRSKHIISQV